MTNPTGSAIEQLKNGFFPGDWSYVPVDKNKATYVAWGKGGLGPDMVLDRYNSNFHLRPDQISKYPGCTEYAGIGVLTGKESQGLLTIDIDGHLADARWKEFLGEHYEEHGKETTMAWWSGTPGRRQIAYMLPTGLVPSLDKIKSIIFKEDGTWAKGGGDQNRTAEEREKKYEEVVLRFNGCMSVLPGSVHPSDRTYEWLNYNDGMPAPAPMWLLEVLEPYRNALSGWDHIIENRWDMDALEVAGQIGNAGKYAACYEWWNRDEVQEQLIPRMKELIFNDPTFEKYGWVDRDGGDNPQYTSGCPIHGGESGTSFQIQQSSGLWHCKGCSARGNMLSFAMKTHLNDWDAEPAAWRSKIYEVMHPIAKALGYDLDEEIREIKKTRVEMADRKQMKPDDWFAALGEIYDTERNPAVKHHKMRLLAQKEGFSQMTGTQCEASLIEYRYAKKAEEDNSDPFWFNKVEKLSYLIPDFIRKPSITILFAQGGCGKTATAMAFMRSVLYGESMKIRGMEMPVEKGGVLLIQSDQSESKLVRDLEDNKIDPQECMGRFVYKRRWQMNQTDLLGDWIREHEPSLVVIDSLGSCSSRMVVSEIEKAYAHPIYDMQDLNGNVSGHDGWPATSFLIIHHTNAEGNLRGTKFLENSVDETWKLMKPSDRQKPRLTESGYNAENCRLIEVCKSRLGREGDHFVVERDHDYRFEVNDWTPIVKTGATDEEGVPLHDPNPREVVLEIVVNRCQEQRDQEKPIGVNAREVYELLCERMSGWTTSKPPSSRSVRNWLKRYFEDGLLQIEKKKKQGGTSELFLARTLPSPREKISQFLSNPSQEQGSEVCKEETPSDVCTLPEHSTEQDQPTQEMSTPSPETESVQTPEASESCTLSNPGSHSDLEEESENSSGVSDNARARAHEEEDFWTPDEDDTEEPDLSGF